MLPMLVLHCLLAVMKGTLNSLDHYAMPEYAGVFFNLVMIVCALALAPGYGITSLAIGVVAGSLLQVLIQFPTLRRCGIRYRPTLAFSHPALREMGGLALGAFIATAVVPSMPLWPGLWPQPWKRAASPPWPMPFGVFLLPVSVVAVPVYTVLPDRTLKRPQPGTACDLQKTGRGRPLAALCHCPAGNGAS